MVFQILLLSFSLALDAFSVSIAGGMQARNAKYLHAFKVAAFFGIFQAVMPVLGFFLGETVKPLITGIDHWIAFVLLGMLGAKMIRDAFDEKAEQKNLLDNKTLILLSIATSIDALVVGITLSLVKIPFIISVTIIGLVTFVLCFLGFMFGEKLGARFGKRVEIMGGLVLIGIGTKILLEHLI